MKISRAVLLLASVALSVGLAFALRDEVQNLILVPLYHVLWQLDILMGSVAELVRWLVLVIVLSLVMAWQLVPDIKLPSRRPAPPGAAVGQVETVAVWLWRARASNYFKWQLAHRLGRIWQQLADLGIKNRDAGQSSRPVLDFLAAGLNRSFVDFPARQRLLGPSSLTVLDIEPGAVVDYLESELKTDWGDRAKNL